MQDTGALTTPDSFLDAHVAVLRPDSSLPGELPRTGSHPHQTLQLLPLSLGRMSGKMYTPKELREFLTAFQQQHGESLLAWSVRAWDAGARSLSLLREELNLMSPLSTDAQVQYYLTQLTAPQDGAGNIIVAPTLYQWLCAAVVGAYPSTDELAATVGAWRTLEEGINMLRQLGVAIGLADGEGPDGVEITRQMKTQLLRGAPSALKPLLFGIVMPATGTVGQTRAVWNSKGRKLAGTTKLSGKVTRRQMWTDLLQAGVLRDEINGLSTADLFKRWQRLPANQQYRTQPTAPPAPTTAWKLRPKDNEGKLLCLL
uniref:Uncharacterized protein n=1 Tax=Apteryx owenii TaxID=8824 RepID=A0A8B9NVV7_APTOW